jgi:vancomycin resistance protein VanW
VPPNPPQLGRPARRRTDVRSLPRRRFTERHPALYSLAVRAHQARRHAAWLTSGTTWATRGPGTPELPVRVKKHGSLLLRELSPDEMELQHNKVVNLRLAGARTDGVVIRPGETFSFNKVVGNCTARKGYVVGMRLSNGEARSGVGGGICQLANLLHWMFLHSPLTVVERSEHSFDPFPDKNRVLPWGVGCSIVWNYVDLVVRNDTAVTFQLHTWLDDRHLRGELRADRPVEHSYRVEARHEEFVRTGGRVWRRNEIWRTVIDRRTGAAVGEELVKRNCAVVKYPPPEHLVVEVDQDGWPVAQPTTAPLSTTRAGPASTARSARGSLS